tara:strand:+ start:402 stop:590 length:189 start_codon:yes stop_codon:yes gene_type:complete
MNKLQRSADGIFLTSANPSPLMQTVMEKIRQQQQAENARREAIRSGKIEQVQSTNWNISDRH